MLVSSSAAQWNGMLMYRLLANCDGSDLNAIAFRSHVMIACHMKREVDAACCCSGMESDWAQTRQRKS
jgi:hypothetical protein